jgi:hypothetical protein
VAADDTAGEGVESSQLGGTLRLIGCAAVGRTGNSNCDVPARSVKLPTSTKDPPSRRLEPLCQRPQGAVAATN